MTDASPDDALAEREAEQPGLPPSRPLEIVTAVVSLLVFALVTWLAGRIELRAETGGIDPRWWPRALGLAGMAVSAALLVVAVVRTIPRDDIESTTRTGWIRLGVVLAATAAFAVAWPAVGFLPSALVYALVLIAVLGGRGWKTLVIFPVGVTAFIYLLFHTLLKVPL